MRFLRIHMYVCSERVMRRHHAIFTSSTAFSFFLWLMKICLCQFWDAVIYIQQQNLIIISAPFKLSRLKKIINGNTTGGPIAYCRRAFNRGAYHNLVKEKQLDGEVFGKYFRLIREQFTVLWRHTG